jgi:hypothetical protein
MVSMKCERQRRGDTTLNTLLNIRLCLLSLSRTFAGDKRRERSVKRPVVSETQKNPFKTLKESVANEKLDRKSA